jgi:uncharacterized protein YunC (DUF1805 family)
MIEVSPLRIGEKVAVGLRVKLPDSPPLLMIIGRIGFVGCGFINVEAAEKLDVAAATVTGVESIEDVLDAAVKAATSKAREKGVRVGMKGKEVMKLFL